MQPPCASLPRSTTGFSDPFVFLWHSYWCHIWNDSCNESDAVHSQAVDTRWASLLKHWGQPFMAGVQWPGLSRVWHTQSQQNQREWLSIGASVQKWWWDCKEWLWDWAEGKCRVPLSSASYKGLSALGNSAASHARKKIHCSGWWPACLDASYLWVQGTDYLVWEICTISVPWLRKFNYSIKKINNFSK